MVMLTYKEQSMLGAEETNSLKKVPKYPESLLKLMGYGYKDVAEQIIGDAATCKMGKKLHLCNHRLF